MQHLAMLNCKGGVRLKNNMKEIRAEQDLTIKELSERCGVSVRQLQRVENGESDPTLGTMLRIAWGLRKDVWEVFGTENCI